MSGVPEHKCIPGTAITVDAFRHQQPWVKAYFLSHAHSDHYTGLTENWAAGPIYCSPVTAALAQQLCGVPASFLRPLPLKTPHTIDEQPGLTVVLVDANHCPGAVQFLFTVPDGRRFVHCGDMRYRPAMKDDEQLQQFVGADGVFLDTTYCQPRHLFPPQDEAVEFVASRIRQLLQEDDACSSPTAAAAGAAVQMQMEAEAAAPTTPRQLQQQQQDDKQEQLPQQSNDQQPQQQDNDKQQQQQQQQDEDKPPPLPAAAVGRFRRLYMISTYVIGKERLLLAAAAATGRRLLVSQRKMNVLRCVGLSAEQLQRCFTTDPAESPIHVTGWGHLGDTWPYFRPNFSNMEAARQQAGAEEVVGFVPTGWLYEMKKSSSYPSRAKGPCSVHLVPYSEHSSYAELREYVAWLRPKQIIPTVGTSGGDKARTAMLQHFRGLIDEQHNKAAFLARMASGGAASKRVLRSSAGNAAADQAAAAAVDVDGSEAAAAAGDGNGVDVMVLDDDGAAAAAAGCAGVDVDGNDGLVELPQQQQRSASLAAAAAADASVLKEAQAAAAPHPGDSICAAAPVLAAAAAVGSSADAVHGDAGDSVQLLLAIVGPDSGLTAAEAQQLLAAAAGDVNAAMNAFLDKQARQQQARPQQGGSRLSGSKRQQQQQGGGADARSSGGSKKARKQPAAAAAAGGGGNGQASITSFFGVRASPKQQQQANSLLQHTGAPAVAEADNSAAVSPPMLVLPALTKRPAAPAAGDGSKGRQLRRSGLPAVSFVQQQQQLTDSRTDATLPTPAETAGTVLGGSADVDTQLTAAGQSPLAAPVVEDDRMTTDVDEQQQQQQQQKQKQLWSTLLSGSSPSSSKRTNKRSQAGDTAAGAVSSAAAIPAADAQQPPAAALNAAAEVPSPATSPPAAAAAIKDPTVHMLGVTTNSGSSSSKPLSKAVREAPLLKLAKYNPLHDACWTPAEAAPYLAVAVTLAAIDGTSSRLLIADGLTNMFRSLMLLAPDQVTAAAYLVAGKIAPEYALGADLNIGGSVVSSALREACGVSRGQLRELYNSMGDLGDVAQACRRKQSNLLPPPPLTISGVFAALHSLASQSGQGAAGRRQATVAKLLRCCRDVETKYLVRTLIQNLRVGASWRSVLGPLAKAALLHRQMMQDAGVLDGPTQQQQGVHSATASSSSTPVSAAAAAAEKRSSALVSSDVADAAAAVAASSAAKVSKKQLEAAAAAAATAYHSCPNLDIIVRVLMAEGPEALAQHVQLTCGVPVKPMLAKACTSVADSFVQLAGTAAAAAAGGVRVGRRSGVKQGAKDAPALATAASPAAAAAAVVVVSDDEADGSGDGADSSDGDGEEDEEATEQLAATTAAAAAGAGAGVDQAASPSGKQQQQQQVLPQDVVAAATASGSSSSSNLALLAEYKYDGQRAQIHVGADHKVAVFSRNCEDRTASFCAEAQAVLAAADPAALPLVIDAELVAVDRANGNRVRAFQELATRPRGSSAAATAAAGGSAASPGTKQQQQPGKQQRSKQQQQQLAFGAAAVKGKQAESAEASGQRLAAEVEASPAPGQQQQQAGSSSAVEICVFAFDALCVGGKDLMGLSLRERRAALAAALPGLTPGVVQLAEGVEVQLPLPGQGGPLLQQAAAAAGAVTAAGAAEQGGEAAAAAAAAAAAEPVVEAAVSGSAAEESVTEFFFSALAAGSEGLMMKLLDGPGSVYQPAKRGLSWVKLKRDYLEGLADSLDLVPIGAWRGNGRKVKWFSPFLLAVYDADTETFQSLCRCMSGFTDEFYAAATARLGATVIPGPKPYYDTHERPDVWFEPTEVWELRGADITISPVHRAAAGAIDPAKGLGLRFPRFLRLRPDKKPEEASGPEQIADLYNKQARRVR